MNKSVLKRLKKKFFNQLSGVASTRKLVEIHNIGYLNSFLAHHCTKMNKKEREISQWRPLSKK